jgi:hypothetical protein
VTSIPVTLQVNLVPQDVDHAELILPHQLRTWAGQVDEVVLSVDGRASRGERFARADAEQTNRFDALLAAVTAENRKVRIVPVDYSGAAKQAVADTYFGGAKVPDKDFRGGPFYSYFHGLHAATSQFVFHSDSDMLYGGGSQTWMQEACELIASREDVLFANPLPGPPTRSGDLYGQEVYGPVREGHQQFRFAHVSTRLFLTARASLRNLTPIPITRYGGARQFVAGIVRRQPNFGIPEDLLSARLKGRGHRVDFLGEPPGMWAVHPLRRPPPFYRALPGLIEKVESGDMPVSQQGRYDLVDELVG